MQTLFICKSWLRCFKMNILSAWVVKKCRKASNKAKHKIFRIESSIRYGDQSLWETKFSDGALLSVYSKFSTCSCGLKGQCKHTKMLCKIYNVDTIAELDPMYTGHVMDSRIGVCVIRRIQKDGVSMISMNSVSIECPICFEAFSDGTKLLTCKQCNKSVHKACWKQWENMKKKEDRCLVCTGQFTEEALVDNEGYKI